MSIVQVYNIYCVQKKYINNLLKLIKYLIFFLLHSIDKNFNILLRDARPILPAM